jgi:hypothetical protein
MVTDFASKLTIVPRTSIGGAGGGASAAKVAVEASVIAVPRINERNFMSVLPNFGAAMHNSSHA